MIDRAFLLSHQKFHQKNFNFIINTLLSNNYPLQFIFDTISIRLKTFFKKRTKNRTLTILLMKIEKDGLWLFIN